MGKKENDFEHQGLVLFGAPGNVGTRTIEKITEEDYPEGDHYPNKDIDQNPVLHNHPSKVIAIADRTRYLVDVTGLSVEDLRGDGQETQDAIKTLLQERGTEYVDPKEVVEAVQNQISSVLGSDNEQMREEHVVYVDMTDGNDLRSVYDEVLLETKSGVVAVNKGVLAELSLEEFHSYTDEGRLEFQPTVGAGANAVAVCMNAAESAHPITEIMATLSGTCGLLSNKLNSEAYRHGDIEFSDIIRELHRDGHTEPHPHTDLSGEDVKKKITILGLASGYDVSMEEIQVASPIVPDDYAQRFPDKKDVDGYLNAMKELDESMREQVEVAHENGMELLYVAKMKVVDGKATLGVGFEEVDPTSKIAKAEDNMIILTDGIETQSMEKPGSGRDVTARSIQTGVMNFVPKGQQRRKK